MRVQFHRTQLDPSRFSLSHLKFPNKTSKSIKTSPIKKNPTTFYLVAQGGIVQLCGLHESNLNGQAFDSSCCFVIYSAALHKMPFRKKKSGLIGEGASRQHTFGTTFPVMPRSLKQDKSCFCNISNFASVKAAQFLKVIPFCSHKEKQPSCRCCIIIIFLHAAA